MNANMKRTMLALAVATLFGTSMAHAGNDGDRGHDRGHDQHSVTYKSATYKLEMDVTRNSDTNINKNVNVTRNVDVRKNKDAHSVDVAFKKSLGLTTDVNISGDPTVSGDIKTDSAAIAVIDNRQSVSGNMGSNDKLSNTSSIGDNVGAAASGNIGMNVAAGDNNAQDNAASLSAADASFSFGMADAEVFVNQAGSGNETMNSGVTNAAGIGADAFSGATGNIGVNVASGNNNEQKNALAASVATTDFAQSSISSNQVSSGNSVSNAGIVQRYDDTTEVSLSGAVQGYSLGIGSGGYAGSSHGSFSGTSSSTLSGTADQIGNVYPDIWNGNTHPGGNQTGHFDLDTATQGGTDLNGDGGALAFGVNATGSGTVGGSTDSREHGQLGFVELSANDLWANLSGSVTTSRYVVVDATNDASLSGNAFQNASGNIGVNVASGTGNLQANSLALAVAQPSTTPPSGGGE
ncbi:adhesin [Rhodanobacter ginsengiterrae]|uniref:adhesin n=1 Tax=Rhodanobacter ginsengiterrae TaxID=2008451 RepID=UPI003CF77202